MRKRGRALDSLGIPNLVRKRKGILLQGLVQKKEVTRSPRTLGLVWKRIRLLIHENSKPHAEEGRREFELQSSSKNSKPYME